MHRANYSILPNQLLPIADMKIVKLSWKKRHGTFSTLFCAHNDFRWIYVAPATCHYLGGETSPPSPRMGKKE